MKTKYKFARVGKNQLQQLLDLNIGRLFVEKEQIIAIKKILKLEGKDVDGLRRIRNTIVRDLHNHEEEIYWNTISGVTAVIDDEMYKIGGISVI